MPETRKSCRHTKSPPAERDEISGKYLDLWQENLKYWANDPDALEKWLAIAAKQIKK